jgi:hypothetical protein
MRARRAKIRGVPIAFKLLLPNELRTAEWQFTRTPYIRQEFEMVSLYNVGRPSIPALPTVRARFDHAWYRKTICAVRRAICLEANRHANRTEPLAAFASDLACSNPR